MWRLRLKKQGLIQMSRSISLNSKHYSDTEKREFKVLCSFLQCQNQSSDFRRGLGGTFQPFFRWISCQCFHPTSFFFNPQMDHITVPQDSILSFPMTLFERVKIPPKIHHNFLTRSNREGTLSFTR